MEATKPKRRKTLRRLSWTIAAALLLVATLPVWFPWVLKPVLVHYGLSFGKYERIGYWRFTLVRVEGSWQETQLEAKQIESVLPTVWLWKTILHRTNDSPFLSLKDVYLTIPRPAEESLPASADQGSFSQTLNQVIHTSQILERVVPVAVLTNGTVQFVSNSIAISAAAWRAGRLEARIKPMEKYGEVDVSAWSDADSLLQFKAIGDAHNLRVAGTFSKEAAGWQWAGEAVWLTNQIKLAAQFATNGWWPAHAQIACPALRLPAQLVHLPGYEWLDASLEVNSSSNAFSLQTAGSAHPFEGDTSGRSPVVEFACSASGNSDSVRVEELRIKTSWLDSGLAKDVGLTWKGELLTEPAVFNVALDLSKLAGTSLTGWVSAKVSVTPRGSEWPSAQFSCLSTNLQAGQFSAKTFRGRGEFAFPTLSFKEIDAELDDSSKLSAGGGYNFDTHQIVEGHWKFAGTGLNRILGDFSLVGFAADGEIRGSITNLSHEGRFEVTGLRGPGLGNLHADAEWTAQNLKVQSLQIDVVGGRSALSITGAADLSAIGERRTAVTLTNVTLRREGEMLYSLAHPADILYQAGELNGSVRRPWVLDIDAFDWRGANRTIEVATKVFWPGHGKVKAAITNFAPRDFSDILTIGTTNFSIAALDVEAHWSNSPIHSMVNFAGAVTDQAGRLFGLKSKWETGEVLAIRHMAVACPMLPTLSITGSIPVRIVPESGPGLFVWDKASNIDVTGGWAGDGLQALSLPLTTHGRLEVANPQLRLRVLGTPEQPRALVEMGAGFIQWLSLTNPASLPELRDLQLSAEIHEERVTLASLSANLSGQAIEATADWPLPAGAWTNLWSKKKLPDSSRAHGRLAIQGAEMAAVARYLPEVLAPEGKLSGNLELKPGRELEGHLSITNVATRPLGGLSPLRDVAAEVHFNGRRAELRSFSGQLGGQPVRAGGFAEFANGQFEYQVSASGSNVPVARSLELLLRGDFNLQLRGVSNSPPVLSGRVDLRNGLYVQHTSALVWSGPKRAAVRPPYFSVTNDPWADWGLNLAISGDRFLRVRTPIFTGLLDANLKLGGTLRQPVLTGDVHAESGRITFPFGRLDLSQASANFSGNDSSGPNLQITASGRNYRYDLRLDVEGPASTANVTFSSTPPLSSEEIVLMLTAGEVPRSDFNYSNEARARQLAAFLGNDLLSRFLGSSQSQERIIIRSGENISQEGRLTYSVEYRLTDWLSIIGEYDQYNAFNADLKWKILTR